ncbi:EF-hand calcium-binding domain-containing protein 14 isoform X2 [Esox lucius]|uniref:EF-hand calcium-binding domain-containing protein 14 isoform X2 n=1 Tax=Esox lucius TaxID=8010 RepID=UPI000576D457|nr:EF-hand calcium-binding domain-containing protein 14 isoform X2 [Esox lucius]
MKKRKELNALIGLGDSKRKKTKKGSGHRLLRTEPPPDSESESSSDDDDEFSNLGTVAAFGKSYVQCCNVCYPLFLFIILAACVMACAGLIWMQIALKEDLDSLKEKLHTMESSQKVSSHEMPKLSEDLKTKQRKLEDIESGDRGLNKLWSNLTEMNRKISLLDTAVNHLKANIKSASDLINLPTTVEELQKSVATIGSTLTSVQHDVKTMQTALEDRKKEMDGLKKTTNVTQFREVVSEVNRTQELYHSWADDQIHSLQTTVSNLTQWVSSMEKGPPETPPHFDFVEVVEPVSVSGNATVPAKSPVNESDTNADERTTAPSEATHETSTGSKPTRRPRFLTPKRSKRESGTESSKTLQFPRVSSLKDLTELFVRSGTDPGSQGMSYQVLRKLFDKATPDPHCLERYDVNGDQRFSLDELKAAAGL